MITVLFVCLGNICRSPMAEAVFRDLVKKAGRSGKIMADSCGTSGWHVGSPPHAGTRKELSLHNISYEGIFASALKKEHFSSDYIIAMDESNLNDIRSLRNGRNNAQINLLSYYTDAGWVSVPDPWITGDFALTYELVTQGCAGLLDYIVINHKI